MEEKFTITEFTNDGKTLAITNPLRKQANFMRTPEEANNVFETYEAAKETIKKLPRGVYQIQKVFVVY